MPDIDPAALSRIDSNANASNTPSLGAKTVQGSVNGAQKNGRPTQSAPRIELESLYNSLKNAVGDNWVTYKDCLTKFLNGTLNQSELTHRLDSILATPAPTAPPGTTIDTLLHLHNQLITAVYTNIFRDAPLEPGIAPWASASESSTGATGQSKPLSGDAAEHRLKQEIKHLPPRVRHRLKAIQDEQYKPLSQKRLSYRNALHPNSNENPDRQRNISTSGAAASASNSGPSSSSAASTGLNKDLEIRKRFALPLISENRDIPASSNLIDRLIPICYEEGLSSAPNNPSMCADLLSVALETFLKEVISSVLGRTLTDAPVSTPAGSATSGPGGQGAVSSVGLGTGAIATQMGVLTARYKKQLELEDGKASRGEIKRTEMGLLPAEVQSAKERAGYAGGYGVYGKDALDEDEIERCVGVPGDLRIAWEVGEPLLGSAIPWLGEKIAIGDFYASGDADFSDAQDKDTEMHVNGEAEFTNGFYDEQMTYDDGAMNWQGAANDDRNMLGTLLDECLTIGQ